jgi:two-component system cell cycle sensor histidine kinase PleC
MTPAATESETLDEEARAPAPAQETYLRRRLTTANRVREARDRLTSSTGRPAFDYELLRLFARNRISASLAVVPLVVTVGFLSGVWTNVTTASAWTAGVLAVHGVIAHQCQRFLAQSPGSVNLRAWRIRFIALDFVFGIAWMLNVVTVVGGHEAAGTFMLFLMLLMVAVSSMLASSLPVAVLAATMPVTTAVVVDFILRGDIHSYILIAMAVTAQIYFGLLSQRLYSTTLATIEARAEKDALIGELEQAKANSDEARRRA